MHHHLSDASVRAATVLGSWASLPELVPRNELIELFKNKCRRLKGKESCEFHDDDNEVIYIE
jgi:hypothetical protein